MEACILSLDGDGEPLDMCKQRGHEMKGVDLAVMGCMYGKGCSGSWKGERGKRADLVL